MAHHTVNILFFAALVLVLLCFMATVIAMAHREQLGHLWAAISLAARMQILLWQIDFLAWRTRRSLARHLRARQQELFTPKQ